jgi:hypothetical protein
MYLRSAPTTTLYDLRDTLDDGHTAHNVTNAGFHLDLTSSDPSITLRTADDTEIAFRANRETLDQIGMWADVPQAFLRRLDPDQQEFLLSSLLTRTPASAVVNVLPDDMGIASITDARTAVIDPRRIVDVALKTLPREADVVESHITPKLVQFDAVVPENFDRGIGGDPRVGDITRGGLRFSRDVQHNLAPGVQPFFYRLVCTNGMETVDEGLRVDGRGQSVEQVLAELEIAAERAFSGVEAEIAAFYELRTHRLDNPERTLVARAREASLPARTVADLVARVPSITEDDGSSTEFAIVNLITNAANNPSIHNRLSIRRNFEQIGGSLVTSHTDRCGHCQSPLALN